MYLLVDICDPLLTVETVLRLCELLTTSANLVLNEGDRRSIVKNTLN